MAIVRKVTSKNSEPVAKAAPKPKAAPLVLSLTEEASEPSGNLSDYSILIFGAKGIGKTDLASQFDNPYFLSLEPGTGGLRVRGSFVPDWRHFVGYIDLLEKRIKTKGDIGTVVVDVIDLAYDHVYDFVCKQLMVESPTEENDFGATWRKIRKMFREQMLRILSFPCGKIFLSHDTEKEVELRDGSTVDRIQPTMSKQAMQEVEGLVDIAGNYYFDGEDRFLRIDGSQTMVAKCRCKEHFLRAGGKPGVPGDRIKVIPMGRSAEQAYENLMTAFNNEQERPDPTQEPVKPKMVLKKKPA